jgi:NADPH:quinone reductase-like Zn-dependent oxidoreductase
MRLQGLVVGSRQHQIDLVRALDALTIKPVIDKSFHLEGIADAFRLQQAGGHFGKIALEF